MRSIRIALLLMLASSPAAATTVVAMRFSEIVTQSELIVVATAGSSFSRWEDGKTIRTYVAFHNLQVHKGAIGDAVLTLRFEGGTVGDTTIAIAAMPTFERGKRYLLFIRRNGKNLSPITGFFQGVFAVQRRAKRDVLIGSNGLELIDIRSDRFAFVGKKPTTPRSPTVVGKSGRRIDAPRLAVAPSGGALAQRKRADSALPIVVHPDAAPAERLQLDEILRLAKKIQEVRR